MSRTGPSDRAEELDFPDLSDIGCLALRQPSPPPRFGRHWNDEEIRSGKYEAGETRAIALLLEQRFPRHPATG